MTDVLVRPDAAGPDDGSRPDAGRAPEGAEARSDSEVLVSPLRWFLAAALVGAGAIHLAMAPSHLGESGVEGAGFLGAAWLQLALAGAVARRPVRPVLAAVSATSLVLVGAWVVSRTAGLPFGAHSGHAESVSFVDATCVALEVVALVLAVVLATGLGTALAGAARTALVGAVAALVVATGAIASPSARNHAAASHGTHGGEMAGGHAHGSGGAADDKGFSELNNGHQHEHTTDEPLTSDERILLMQQLSATTELVERYPTLGDAEAAGWWRAGPFSPGLGTHYGAPMGSRAFGDEGVSFDPMDPADMPTPMLIYDGVEADAPLAGFMFSANGVEAEPEGFAGPNDHWHYHEAVCIKFEDGVLQTPFGADRDDVTRQMCDGVGGQWIENTGYMVHVWNVPGYESPDGMFTEVNRKITCPDGTYHTIDIQDVGNRDTVCRNS